MKNILITGCSGNLSRYLIRVLSSNPKINVIGISRTQHDNNCFRPNVEVHVGDLQDQAFVTEIISYYRECTVIHCASSWNGFNKDSEILKNNTVSTLNVLNSLRPDVKHLVLVSSSGVYEKLDCLESSKLPRPRSSYGLSKQVSESLVKQYSYYNNYSYTIWRPFHILSPWEKGGHRGAHVCTDLAVRLIENNEEHVWVQENDTKCIPLTWIGDIANCIVDNLETTRAKNQSFNIARNELVSVNQIARVLIEIAKGYGLCVNAVPNVTTDSTLRDTTFMPVNWFDKVYDELGWVAQTGVQEMLDNFVRERYKLV